MTIQSKKLLEMTKYLEATNNILKKIGIDRNCEMNYKIIFCFWSCWGGKCCMYDHHTFPVIPIQLMSSLNIDGECGVGISIF